MTKIALLQLTEEQMKSIQDTGAPPLTLEQQQERFNKIRHLNNRVDEFVTNVYDDVAEHRDIFKNGECVKKIQKLPVWDKGELSVQIDIRYDAKKPKK